MKKALAFLIAIPLFLCLSSCAEKTYKLPWDPFCSNGSATVNLEGKERKYIIDLLNESNWENGVTNCACDFTFFPQEQTVEYHSACGTFNDITRGKTARISEEQRLKLNSFLGVGSSK